MTVHTVPFSLYMHIPFCQTRCSYCAFNTYAGLRELFEPYLAALQRETELIARASGGIESHTLYFGGGTPSLLTPAQIESLIATCREHLGLLPDAEITLEANPGTAEASKLAAFRAAGVNRLSLGVQSSHADELRLFGRRHTFEEAEEAFCLGRVAGFDNISVDLIYGAPLQTRRRWRQTLNAVLDWRPDHVSLYSLTLEPGTSLARRVERGAIPQPDPDLAADLYDKAREQLAQAGLVQYEISNWARPGYESRHNRQYWLNRPFLGFGAGAHGAAAHLRYWNVDPVRDYITRIHTGEMHPFPLSPAVGGFEVIDRRMEMSETLILGLRLVREGVHKDHFAQRFGCTLDEVFGPALDSSVQLGLIEIKDNVVRLTERGYLLSNQVFWRLMPDEG